VTTATKYDRRMYAIMNNRAAAPMYATATRRRAVFGVHLLLTAASFTAWATTVFSDARWPLFAMLALLPLWVVATGVINGATRGLLELRGRMLDERQLAERDRVHAIAHRITGVLLLLAAVGVGSAGWFADVRAEGLVAPELFAALAVHLLMPLWVAGLRIQDDPAED
jgi:membrane protein YdbS with pleckstrin-like domain